MQSFTVVTGGAGRRTRGGGAVVAGALLLALTAIGIPAAAVWVGNNIAAQAPAPIFYVAGQ